MSRGFDSKRAEKIVIGVIFQKWLGLVEVLRKSLPKPLDRKRITRESCDPKVRFQTAFERISLIFRFVRH